MSNVFSIKEIEEKERMREALKNMACSFTSDLTIENENGYKIKVEHCIGMKVAGSNFKPRITGLSA